MENLTERMADFVFKTKFEDISRDVIEKAKLYFLDVLGTLLAGAGIQGEAGKIICHYVQHLGGKPDARVVKAGFKTSPPLAALANGVMANALDYDDVDWPSKAHPSAVIFPTVLALGEALNHSGKDVLTAYILGVEVITKIGLGVSPVHYDRGWETTSTLGVLGAAAAASKLLKLDSMGTRMALGIAASEASGIRGNFTTMTKAFHIGKAAFDGIMAASLVAEGFTADPNILERSLGFCSIFTEGVQVERMIDGLGDVYSFIHPGLAMKIYPSCAATHSSLDGISYLIQKYDIKPENVESVECGIFYLHPKFLLCSYPQTGLEGKFSLEFCVALALKEKNVSIGQFTDSKVKEPEIQHLMRRVTKFVTEELGVEETQFPGAIVKVNLKNGKSYSHKVEKRKGSPTNPLGVDEIINKFVECAQLIHSRDQANRILDVIMNIHHQDSIKKLIEMIDDSHY
jgi:2-methylcitrate dehydratase PrpD